MSHMSDITLRELRNDTSRVLQRAGAGERLRVMVNRRPVAQIVPLDDREIWVAGGELLRRIRGAQADPGLRADLAALVPDTIADL